MVETFPSSYRIYGLTFASRFPFTYRLAPGQGKLDFTFERASSPPLEGWQESQPIYASHNVIETGENLLQFYRVQGCDILRIASVAEFYLFADRILYFPLSADEKYIETFFLSAVLSFWLERSGTLALHASAVALEDRAVGFLSNSGHGKTGLAAMMLQAGAQLLGDDILAVTSQIIAQPAFPTMRMWADEAQHFLGEYESLPYAAPATNKRRVAIGDGCFGSFCTDGKLLSCLFIPRRHRKPGEDQEIRLTRITLSQGVIELVRHSFAARLVQAAGLQPGRMSLFATLVKNVPLYYLDYPTGFEQLPEVAKRITKHVSSLPKKR